jgi:hypothetical protein
MARLAPASISALLKIDGIGPLTAAKYGQAFLQAITTQPAVSVSAKFHSASASAEYKSFAATERWGKPRRERELADGFDCGPDKRMSTRANPNYVPVYARKADLKDK